MFSFRGSVSAKRVPNPGPACRIELITFAAAQPIAATIQNDSRRSALTAPARYRGFSVRSERVEPGSSGPEAFLSAGGATGTRTIGREGSLTVTAGA
jgi:hypothetical protein